MRGFLIYCFTTQVIIFSAAGNVFAQKQRLTEQIEIIRPYKPVLGEAVKIKSDPVIKNDSSPPLKQSYSFGNEALIKDSLHDPLLPDTLQLPPRQPLKPFLLRIGGGNDQTLLGEAYYNSKPYTDGNYGAYYQHLSQQGRLENQKYLNDRFKVFGKRIFSKNALSAEFILSQKRFDYYGYDHALYAFNDGSVKQRYSHYGANVNLESNRDPAAIYTYYVKINGYRLGDFTNNKERNFSAAGFFGYRIGDFRLNLSSEVNDNHFNTFQLINHNGRFAVDPSVSYQTDPLRITGGLRFVNQFGDGHSFKLFPFIDGDLKISDQLHVFGGLTGDVVQNTYQSLTDQNPYIFNGRGLVFPLNNSIEKICFFLGLKGLVLPSLSFNVKIAVSQYDKLPFFAVDYPQRQYYGIAYDGNGTRKSEITASLNYALSDKLLINFDVDYRDIKTKTLAEPWFVPKTKLELQAHYRLMERLIGHVSLFSFSSQKANAIGSIGQDGPEAPLGTISVRGYTDINAGLEYRFLKSFSVFVQGNNLLNKNYEPFLFYPVFGAQFLAGASIVF